MNRRWAGRIGGFLFVLAGLNFLAFYIHCTTLGGSAGNGKRDHEHFYVGEHGRYTEVTQQQWQIARAHEYSMFGTLALAILVGTTLLAYSERGPKETTPSES